MKKLFLFIKFSAISLVLMTGIRGTEVEGVQKCQLLSNSTGGFCTSIYECPSVLNSWKLNNSNPVYCSEEAKIVCCPYQLEGDRNVRISERKCMDYIKYTFEQVKIQPEDPEDDYEISYLDRCGISTQKYAIVGGEDASMREYPHMAAIGDNAIEMDDIENFVLWFCAGSLISENFVLTAAHCINTNKKLKGKEITPKVVKLGAWNLNEEESTVRIYEVEQKIAYPGYENQYVYYDIGLLKLKEKVQFDINVRPICLPVDTSEHHAQIWAIGWGNYKGASYEGILQKLKLPLVTVEDCSKTYNAKRKRLPHGLNQNILCYGAVKGVDTCPGASGGPVQIVKRDVYCSYSLIGVTSAGVRCTEGYPGLFTKVSEYLDWIEAQVWGVNN